MMELIERRDVASQKMGVRLFFSQNDLVILILVPVRRNDQPLVLMGKRASRAPNFVPSEGTKSQKPQISQNRAFFCPLKGDEIMTAA